MAINYARLRSLTARQIIRALVQDGFRFRRQLEVTTATFHPDGRRVTVRFSQLGDTFKIKNLKSIIERQASWNKGDLRRLRLI